MTYEWHDEPPKEDGYFYYTGPLPHMSIEVTEIVQITTVPQTGERMASWLMPAYWWGHESNNVATQHVGTLDNWKGQWAGPKFGLNTVVSGGTP